MADLIIFISIFISMSMFTYKEIIKVNTCI